MKDLIVESHATYLLILICSVFSFQCTEEDHGDKEDLRKAVTIMADVAAFINESKRRKDIGKETYWYFLLEERLKAKPMSNKEQKINTRFSFPVDKYRNVEDKTLTRKISKLNMHSIGKKSSRISQRVLNTLGIDAMVTLTV